MAFARLGIGARLFIAFVGITAVSLSSGIASWYVLREISGAQSLLISQALPAAWVRVTWASPPRMTLPEQAMWEKTKPCRL